MPEGPEYALTAKEFNEKYMDDPPVVVNVFVQKNKKTNDEFINKAKSKLNNKTYVETIAHGKSLFIVFQNDNRYSILHSKFGLHGSWQIADTKNDDDNTFSNDARMSITFDDGTILIYTDPPNFGHKYIISYKTMLLELANTSDPIKEDIQPHTLETLLTNGRIKTKPIAKLLLDQDVIVGIGNYLRAEILYKAKIHPLMPANEIMKNKEIFKKLLNAINSLPIKIYAKIEKHRPDTEIFKVYDRETTPDNKKIDTITIDGRKCYFVPSVQKLN
jgi:formamidopyrimidine-DNA glycosylase